MKGNPSGGCADNDLGMAQTSKLAKVTPAAVGKVREAESLKSKLVETLDAIGKAKGLSEATRDALSGASWDIARMDLEKVLERALDELDAVPAGRVDTDHLKSSHGVNMCFDLWLRNKEEGTKPYRGGRTTGDDHDLITRFMKSHRGLEVSVHVVPFGGNGERFSIRGTKAAREKFENDPRWPKLKQALEDIAWTDHAGGYADEVAKRRRKIKDPMAHVFGK